MRNAIDKAEIKKKNSSFFYKLQNLNDKIYVFRSLFYTKKPHFQRRFLEKKKTMMEHKLKNQMKEDFLAKMEKLASPKQPV